MMLLALLLSAMPDTPRAIVLTPESGAMELVVAAPASSTAMPSSLVDARKMAEQLRYEEAVVEYQRYLATPDRPLAERANALLELGFVHLVLGDASNAETRAIEALELDPKLSVPSTAPAKQVDFVAKMRKLFLSRARLELQQRNDSDPPYIVRVKVLDPEKKVTRVLLRHALTSTGPYYSSEMTCEDDLCTGAIPPPQDVSSFTAWYFVEALDPTQLTAAKVASPETPLQLSIVDQKPWYTSPVVWGISGAAMVGIATVVFLLAPQPPK
jgi:tetratricopeptide (TPR) repeat protein